MRILVALQLSTWAVYADKSCFMVHLGVNIEGGRRHTHIKTSLKAYYLLLKLLIFVLWQPWMAALAGLAVLLGSRGANLEFFHP